MQVFSKVLVRGRVNRDRKESEARREGNAHPPCYSII